MGFWTRTPEGPTGAAQAGSRLAPSGAKAVRGAAAARRVPPGSSHPVPIKPGITDGTATGPIKRTAGMRPPRPLGARYQKHQ